tara:strand:+ start:1489 stop:1827 length:339 start_codon:yes stop_codon:yes gene_type:complete
MGGRSSGLNAWTLQESNNAGLGQGGSIFIDTLDTDYLATTYDKGSVFIAITIVISSKFNDLISTAPDRYIGTTGAMGSAIDNSNVFPAGITIFGRWTTIDLDAGTVIAYLGC